MMKAFAHLVVLIAAGVAGAQSPSPSPTELLPELRKGGYVLFLRHPQTNPDQADTDPLNLDNVQAQRQLSDEGRQQAKALGEAFRALKIPVGKIISSKFERAREAARFLGVGEVTTSVGVTEGGLVVSPPRKPAPRRGAARVAFNPDAGRPEHRHRQPQIETWRTPRARSSATWPRPRSSCSSPSAEAGSRSWLASPRRRPGADGRSKRRPAQADEAWHQARQADG